MSVELRAALLLSAVTMTKDLIDRDCESIHDKAAYVAAVAKNLDLLEGVVRRQREEQVDAAS